MKTGLLWFDNDPNRSLEEKVARASQRYEAKFGRLPNSCYVNPALLEAKKQVGDIQVMGADNILPHHFMIGISES